MEDYVDITGKPYVDRSKWDSYYDYVLGMLNPTEEERKIKSPGTIGFVCDMADKVRHELNKQGEADQGRMLPSGEAVLPDGESLLFRDLFNGERHKILDAAVGCLPNDCFPKRGESKEALASRLSESGFLDNIHHEADLNSSKIWNLNGTCLPQARRVTFSVSCGEAFHDDRTGCSVNKLYSYSYPRRPREDVRCRPYCPSEMKEMNQLAVHDLGYHTWELVRHKLGKVSQASSPIICQININYGVLGSYMGSHRDNGCPTEDGSRIGELTQIPGSDVVAVSYGAPMELCFSGTEGDSRVGARHFKRIRNIKIVLESGSVFILKAPDDERCTHCTFFSRSLLRRSPSCIRIVFVFRWVYATDLFRADESIIEPMQWSCVCPPPHKYQWPFLLEGKECGLKTPAKDAKTWAELLGEGKIANLRPDLDGGKKVWDPPKAEDVIEDEGNIIRIRGGGYSENGCFGGDAVDPDDSDDECITNEEDMGRHRNKCDSMQAGQPHVRGDESLSPQSRREEGVTGNSGEQYSTQPPLQYGTRDGTISPVSCVGGDDGLSPVSRRVDEVTGNSGVPYSTQPPSQYGTGDDNSSAVPSVADLSPGDMEGQHCTQPTDQYTAAADPGGSSICDSCESSVYSGISSRKIPPQEEEKMGGSCKMPVAPMSFVEDV